MAKDYPIQSSVQIPDKPVQSPDKPPVQSPDKPPIQSQVSSPIQSPVSSLSKIPSDKSFSPIKLPQTKPSKISPVSSPLDRRSFSQQTKDRVRIEQDNCDNLTKRKLTIHDTIQFDHINGHSNNSIANCQMLTPDSHNLKSTRKETYDELVRDDYKCSEYIRDIILSHLNSCRLNEEHKQEIREMLSN